MALKCAATLNNSFDWYVCIYGSDAGSFFSRVANVAKYEAY